MRRYVVVICRPGAATSEYRLPAPFDVFANRAEAEFVRDWYRACAAGPTRTPLDVLVREIDVPSGERDLCVLAATATVSEELETVLAATSTRA